MTDNKNNSKALDALERLYNDIVDTDQRIRYGVHEDCETVRLALTKKAAQPEGVTAEQIEAMLKKAVEQSQEYGLAGVAGNISVQISKYPNGIAIRTAQQNMGGGE